MRADFDGPLTEFLERTNHIRLIVVALESAANTPAALFTARTGIALSGIGMQTGSTVNAMSLVFLASSFEEFIREEVGQAAGQLADSYQLLSDSAKNPIRASYWALCIDRLRTSNGIFNRNSPPTPDAGLIGQMRILLNSAKGFGLDDDASVMDRKLVTSHKHNMKPDVVNELGRRIGLKDLISDAAESHKIKARFNTIKKSEATQGLRSKLEEFYSLRNSIVHSLSDVAGQGVEVVLDYLEFFESVAEAIKAVMIKTAAKWPSDLPVGGAD